MKLTHRAAVLALTAALACPGVAHADDAVVDRAALEALLAQAFAPAYGNTFAAHAVYVDVATTRGWAPEVIEANWPLVEAILARETGGSFCPNLRGGDQVDSQCRVTRSGSASGHYSDSGWFQVNGVHWDVRRGGWLCRQEGYCSADDIIATPQTSMDAGLALLERGGKGPWCFSTRSRRSALCRMTYTAP